MWVEAENTSRERGDGTRHATSYAATSPRHIKELEGYPKIIPTITLNEFVNYTSVDSLRNTPEGAAHKLPINKIKAFIGLPIYRLTRFY